MRNRPARSGSTGLVSILVFVELALDASLRRLDIWLRDVSILVFVELALDVPIGAYLFRRHWVSILVFVELALDVYILISRKYYRTKFQSLFSWNLLLMPVVLFVA